MGVLFVVIFFVCLLLICFRYSNYFQKTCDMKTMKCPPAAKTSAKKADEGELNKSSRLVPETITTTTTTTIIIIIIIGFFEKDHFGLVWWIWAAIIGGVLVLIIAGITIACIVRRAKRDTDWGSAVQASAYNNSVMAPSDPSPDLYVLCCCRACCVVSPVHTHP